MAKLGLSLLLVCSILHMVGTVDSAAARNSAATSFIKASCRVTRYPVLCFQCLSGYASTIRQSDRQLALTALSVSLSRARSATVFASKLTKVRGLKPREHEAVKDCIENMADTVDRLSHSVQELGHTGKAVSQDFMWHMSNVQTWVSAALTDENTCLDGFAGRVMEGNVKTAVRRKVIDVAQVTSNALALINRFAAKPRH